MRLWKLSREILCQLELCEGSCFKAQFRQLPKNVIAACLSITSARLPVGSRIAGCPWPGLRCLGPLSSARGLWRFRDFSDFRPTARPLGLRGMVRVRIGERPGADELTLKGSDLQHLPLLVLLSRSLATQGSFQRAANPNSASKGQAMILHRALDSR